MSVIPEDEGFIHPQSEDGRMWAKLWSLQTFSGDDLVWEANDFEKRTGVDIVGAAGDGDKWAFAAICAMWVLQTEWEILDSLEGDEYRTELLRQSTRPTSDEEEIRFKWFVKQQEFVTDWYRRWIKG